VKVQRCDEGDTGWERVESVFRVFLYSGEGPFSSEAHDLTDATLMETLAWAEKAAGPDRFFAIAIVSDDAYGTKGLTWLVGIDANCTPHDTVERRLFNELDRRSTTSFAERGRRARL
jgi:hypothetical protein